MRVAKRFRWEAAHRLPWHKGECNNLHGHSYEMVIEIVGQVGANGMVMDFQLIKGAIKPLVDRWDHGIFVSQDDLELLEILHKTSWKHYLLPYDSTSENIARYAADYLCDNAHKVLIEHSINEVEVLIRETETCFAVYSRLIQGEVEFSNSIANKKRGH